SSLRRKTRRRERPPHCGRSCLLRVSIEESARFVTRSPQRAAPSPYPPRSVNLAAATPEHKPIRTHKAVSPGGIIPSTPALPVDGLTLRIRAKAPLSEVRKNRRRA